MIITINISETMEGLDTRFTVPHQPITPLEYKVAERLFNLFNLEIATIHRELKDLVGGESKMKTMQRDYEDCEKNNSSGPS